MMNPTLFRFLWSLLNIRQQNNFTTNQQLEEKYLIYYQKRFKQKYVFSFMNKLQTLWLNKAGPA